MCLKYQERLGGRICVKYVLWRNLPSTGYEDLVFFLEQMGNSSVRVRQ